MTVAQLGLGATIVLTLGCLGVVAALVILRFAMDRRERRRLTLRAPIWHDVLTLSTGEGEQADEAFARLLAATQAERLAAVDDAFALVPKLRGAARERLRDVLRAWGSLDEALARTNSRSVVRRCRGVYRLGVLRDPAGRERALACLDDRDFAVRRTAMLALGGFPDEVVVEHLLARAALEPRLRRDFLASVERVGAVAVPVLRAGLKQSLADVEGGGRGAHLAASALGLVGAIQAVPELEEALESGSAELKIECSHALGRLGASSSVIALSAPLGHGDADVRRAAAAALGLVGGDWAVLALITVLNDDNVEVARAAANGLHRCGPAGREALQRSSAPVAHEVVALAALGSA